MKERVFLLLPFLLFACSDAGSPDDGGDFAIYTLQDSTIDARTALSFAIAGLPLQSNPFLTAADLKSYIWATHGFDIKPEAGAKWIAFQQRGGKTSGVPFVVTVGSQRIYVGTFWWAYSSEMPPPCAVIHVISYPYSISLQSGAVDYRSDRRVHTALKKAGILVE